MHRCLPLLALLPLAACASDPDFGAVVQRNIVAQAVALDPVYAGVPIEGGNGERGVSAMKRYRAGAVISPEGPGKAAASATPPS